MEIWKDVPGYEGKYQASNQGRIKSLARMINKTNRWGQPWTCPQKERIKMLGRHNCGYLNVSLNNKTFFVHRLIAMTFIGQPIKKMDVNHKNGIKTDNRVENLEWCTRSQNIIHARGTGLIVQKFGNDHHRTKISTEKVLKVISMLRDGFTHHEVAKELSISICLVSKIRNKKSWHADKIEYNAFPSTLFKNTLHKGNI